jgi:8-oxo-dGTP diphosphatase
MELEPGGIQTRDMNLETTPTTKQVIAVRAAIVKDTKVLILRESGQYEEGTQRGKYDLPGGRIATDETIEEALKRETREEAGVDIEILRPFFVGEWRPVVKGQPLQIIGIFFLCSTNDEVVLGTDHDDFRWIGRNDLEDYTILDPVPEALAVLIKEGTL